ncbi:MAG: hypothetical protein DWQ45_01210 [Planctomycetota bacterium]|nr:MAG: hypothetical protein DWQ29_01345 [Planctomycetota bacterium]REK21530.1 MAG: hypothetical protein DWQ41_20885 [Planctomycetota bacterium]REK39915.1 MAG: hypothetical protein DWQ45_01210 [Planctomycetota bacterium]
MQFVLVQFVLVQFVLVQFVLVQFVLVQFVLVQFVVIQFVVIQFVLEFKQQLIAGVERFHGLSSELPQLFCDDKNRSIPFRPLDVVAAERRSRCEEQ